MKKSLFLLFTLLLVVMCSCKIKEDFAYSEYHPQAQYRTMYREHAQYDMMLKPYKIQDKYKAEEMRFKKTSAKKKSETKKKTKDNSKVKDSKDSN